MTSQISFQTTSRFTFWRAIGLAVLSTMMVVCLHSGTAGAEEASASRLTLQGLQVNRNGISSSFTVTNTGTSYASLHLSYRTDSAPDVEIYVQDDSPLTPNEPRRYDLTNSYGLPDYFRGFVVISSNQPLTGSLDLRADFFSTKREGNPPFAVQFVDTSSGDYSNRLWDFGDGQTSTEVTPTHTYAVTGTYSVKLMVSGVLGSDTITKSDLIKVHTFPAIHPDGWDLNFGDYGALDINTCSESRYDLFVQSDGRVLVANSCGYVDVHRYLADGTIDLTFGLLGKLQMGKGNNVILLGLPNDDFIVTSGLTLWRFKKDGRVDSTFGDNGHVNSFPTATAQSLYFQAKLQQDGKIIVAGTKDQQPILVRYTTDGKLDTTFNGQGYHLTEISEESKADEWANSWQNILIFPNNKIWVVRTNRVLEDPLTQRIVAKNLLVRYNSDGTIDSNFGNSGVIETENRLGNLMLQSENKVIAGYSNGYMTVRFNYDGSLDSSFVREGDPISVIDNSFPVMIDEQKRIYLLNLDMPGGEEFYRLLPDGTHDKTFGGDKSTFGVSNALVVVKHSSSLRPRIFRDLQGNLLIATDRISRYIESHPAPAPTTKPLTLLYAVLDNNLGEDATRLLNNVEAGVRPGTNVRLLVDGPGENDVYLYNVMQDSNPFCPSASNPTCDGRYAEGINFWHLANENSAHPDSLYQFVVDGINAFTNTSSINVALIGHGSGWSANVLPGQPSIWRGQNDTLGGMLWDDHPGAGQSESRSLSTLMLGQALSWASAQTGRTIDLLYLDGCSMGMAEVAYEVRDSAKLLLASPNIDWASFNYDELLPEMTTLNGQALAERWLTLEAARLRSTTGYPFTLSLVDLSKLGDLVTATTGLADALQSVLPSQRAAIGSAFQLSDKFESNYDGAINNQDSYVDLGDFAQQLAGQLPTESTLISATQAVQNALNATIIGKEHEDGTPWMFQDQQWAWNHYSGLAIYAPLGQDEARRQIFYNADNLSLAADTSWDEFLTAYWAGSVQAAAMSMPVCHQTSDGCVGLANPLPVQAEPVYNVFMPMVAR